MADREAGRDAVIRDFLERFEERQFHREFERRRFLVIDPVPYSGGFGGQLSLRVLGLRLGTMFEGNSY